MSAQKNGPSDGGKLGPSTQKCRMRDGGPARFSCRVAIRRPPLNSVLEWPTLIPRVAPEQPQRECGCAGACPFEGRDPDLG